MSDFFFSFVQLWNAPEELVDLFTVIVWIYPTQEKFLRNNN